MNFNIIILINFNLKINKDNNIKIHDCLLINYNNILKNRIVIEFELQT